MGRWGKARSIFQAGSDQSILVDQRFNYICDLSCGLFIDLKGEFLFSGIQPDDSQLGMLYSHCLVIYHPWPVFERQGHFCQVEATYTLGQACH